MLRQTKLKALLTLLASTLFATLVRAETQSCLVDLESGQTILSEAADERIENNSTAGLMVAYTALSLAQQHDEGLEKPVVALDEKTNNERTPNLADAIEAVLLANDREAIERIVHHFGADIRVFVRSMNEEAARLGLAASRFETPFPSDGTRKNTTTAADTAKLAADLYRRFPFTRIWTSSDSVKFGNRDIENGNFLRQNKAITGVFAHVAENAVNGAILAEDPRTNGRTRRLLAISLHEASKESFAETITTLLMRGYRDFETVRVFKRGDVVGSVPVYKGNKEEIELRTTQDVFVTLTKERMLELGELAFSLSIEYNRPIVAPVDKETRIGQLIISVDDRTVATMPLVAAEDIRRGNFLRRLTDTIKIAIGSKNSRNQEKND